MNDKDFTLSEPDRSARLLGGIHREYIAIAKSAALLIGGGGLLFAIASGALTAAVMAAAPLWVLIPVGVAFIVAVAVAVTFLNLLDLSRYALDAILAEWRANQDTARKVATDRAWIEANITVRGNNNTVTLPGVTANQTNQIAAPIEKQFVYVNRGPQLIEGVDVRDWVYFVDRIVTQIGHTKRAWLGTVMPSGWKVAEYTDYARLIEPLERAGLLTGRGERSAGRLATTDADRIKATLGLPRYAGEPVKDITPAANQIEAAASEDVESDKLPG